MKLMCLSPLPARRAHPVLRQRPAAALARPAGRAVHGAREHAGELVNGLIGSPTSTSDGNSALESVVSERTRTR